MDYSKVFKKVDERTWTAESANYTAVVTRNGHCGYWMTLTSKTTGKQSGKLYGKHFKALASWFPIYETDKTRVQLATEAKLAPIEYSKCSKSQDELETQCPDFHNLPCAWMDEIEAHQDIWEKAA